MGYLSDICITREEILVLMSIHGAFLKNSKPTSATRYWGRGVERCLDYALYAQIYD